MNKPEKIVAIDKAKYDVRQMPLTNFQRALEGNLTCAYKEAQAVKDTHPELYWMICCAMNEAAGLHRELSGLQRDMFADKLLSVAHADSIMPWWGPDLTMQTKLPTEEERTLAHCK